MQTSLLPFFPAWPVLLKNLEGLGVVMAMNVHGVLAVHDVLNVLAVHDVLKQGLILLGSLEKSLNVFLVSFFFFFFFVIYIGNCNLLWAKMPIYKTIYWSNFTLLW